MARYIDVYGQYSTGEVLVHSCIVQTGGAGRSTEYDMHILVHSKK